MGEKKRDELVVPLGAVVLAVLAVWLVLRKRVGVFRHGNRGGSSSGLVQDVVVVLAGELNLSACFKLR